MAVVVTRGELPEWARSGSGYGDGSGSGSGSGSGYGSGYGDGSGSGSGSGSGYGDGSGSGSGYGSGYGDGDGDGYGSGYGYGDGSGSGSGYGYGYGDGYWKASLSAHPEAADHVSRGAELGYWRSDRDGRPCNGGSGTMARVGLVEEIPGPLKICTHGALHATLDPYKWKGDRLWVVALYGEIQREEDKLGALKRVFVADLGLVPQAVRRHRWLRVPGLALTRRCSHCRWRRLPILPIGEGGYLYTTGNGKFWTKRPPCVKRGRGGGKR